MDARYRRFLEDLLMVKDLSIGTQYLENYGAHTWDGNGDCPQFWKAKGGEEIIVTDVPETLDPEKVVDMVRGEIEWSSDYSQQYIVGFGLVEPGYETYDERDQREFEGEVKFPATRIAYSDLIFSW
jgi:hypothetical protein